MNLSCPTGVGDQGGEEGNKLGAGVPLGCLALDSAGFTSSAAYRDSVP
jgi:hypothetical protein